MKNILLQKKSNIFFLITCLYLLHATNAQSQVLDETFGNNGLVTRDINGLRNITELVNQIAIQNDGKIIAIVPNFPNNSYFFNNITLVRYQINGGLDSSFGNNGVVVSDFKEYNSQHAKPYTVNVLENGKILVCGDYYGTYENVSETYNFLIQYNSNGDLDSSFGINGKATGVFGQVISVAIQKDGKILATGSIGPIVGGIYQKLFSVARYQSNGTIDSSFGVDGMASVVYDSVSYNDLAYVVNIQNDQKILLGGYTYKSPNEYYLALVRLKADGNLDSSFGSNGKVATLFDEGFVGGIYCIVVQDDGKIIISGGRDYDFVRYNNNGGIDSTFGVYGKVKVAGISSSGTQSMVLQKDGKFLKCGTAFLQGAFNQFQIMRFSNNGRIDSSFGTNGAVNTDFDTSTAASCIALQSNGNVIVGGLTTYYYNGNSTGDLAMVRYILDDVLATTWNDFTASKKEKTVLLNWQTANENNDAYFSVERSVTGNNNFYAIGKVLGKGSSAQLQPYIFEDINPLKGRNYYRLKQVDANGHFSYSKILLVDFETAAAIKLYPNPVKDILRIEGLNSTGATSLAIVDFSGRVIAKAVTENSNNYSWNIKQLTAGVYYLIISSGGERTTLKLIKE